MKILLDISRTVARARLPAATGIDRVERAYIEWAMARAGSGFLARVGRLQFLLDPDVPRQLLDWFDGRSAPPRMDMFGWFAPQRDPSLRRAQSLVRRRATARVPERGLADMLRGHGWDDAAYLNVGHDNLGAVSFRALGQAGLQRLVLLHDTIPLDHPEFARAGSVEPFREKFKTALKADALIANSVHTSARIAAHAEATTPPVHVLPLGIEAPGAVSTSGPGATPPSFVILGTIEPRKNHRMLLAIWNGMTEAMGASAPHLHIIGRRGWGGPALFEALDWGPAVDVTVHEHPAMEDAEVRQLLSGARALLFPSFAEGYGLPLGEALSLGVPVIASDLPALRQLGGDVPEWLDPEAPDDWRGAIADYADPASPRRAAQMDRLARWQAPTWEAHFHGLENLLETNMVQPVNGG